MTKPSFPVLLLLASIALCRTSSGSAAVEKWQPTDLTFKTTITWQFSPTSPFEVEFGAVITGPDNITIVQPGFYDGDDTWKIRFSPPKEGEWTITTRSDVLELDKKQVKLQCVARADGKGHGGLIVDPQSRRHFIYQDGTRFLPVGFEANWLFALNMDAPGDALPTLAPFLDKLAGSGFNLININVWAYDTNWREGSTEDTDYGPPLLFPWEGTNEDPDFGRFNLKYWQHFDRMMDAMNQRGMVAYLYFKVYNKLASWPKNNSPEDELFFRWVIARYAAYPNVIWSLAKEAQYEKSTRYKVDRLKYIRKMDAYDRLLTVHDDSLTYDLGYYDELVDFRSAQEHKDVHATVQRQLAANDWPLFMAESGYEHGPKGLGDRAFGRSHTPEQVIHYIWDIQMSGVSNTYYYTYAAWDIIRHEDNPPGYRFMKHFSDFFSKTEFWLLKSNDSLVSAGRCLENPGEEYVVYQAVSRPFKLSLPRLPAPRKALWFQPLSGEYRAAGALRTGVNDLQPPAEWVNVPVVLHVR